MPRCLGTSQSVRASNMPWSAWWALVLHSFWPLTTHSSPSSSARVVSPPRSEPLPGSLNSWHHVSSPVIARGSSARLRSSEPWASSVGAASVIPPPTAAPTAPAAANSSDTTASAQPGSPRPYQSTGHVGVAHPLSTSWRRQSSSAASGSQCSASQARTSARTDSGVVIGRSRARPGTTAGRR